MEALRRTVIGVATATSLMIPADKHIMIDPDNVKVSAMKDELNYILYQVSETNPDIRYVYTMVETRDPSICKFVLASEDYGKEEIKASTINYDVSQEEVLREKKAFFRPVATDTFYTDDWGTWLSGYAPLKDEANRTVAVVGVDISMKRVLSYQNSIKYWLYSILGICFFYFSCFKLYYFFKNNSSSHTDYGTYKSYFRRRL